MKHKIISLKNGVYYSLTAILLTTIIVFASVWYINEKRNLKLLSGTLSEQFEKQQKEYLVEEVKKAITTINSIREYNSNYKEENWRNEKQKTSIITIKIVFQLGNRMNQ